MDQWKITSRSDCDQWKIDSQPRKCIQRQDICYKQNITNSKINGQTEQSVQVGA